MTHRYDVGRWAFEYVSTSTHERYSIDTNGWKTRQFCFSPLLLYAFLLSPHVAQHILKEDIDVFACGYCGQSGEYFFEENNPQDFGSVVKLPKDGEVQSRCCNQKFWS